jgi:Fic family protein
MEPEDFNDAAGLVAIASGKAYFTFTPNELPVSIDQGKLANQLANASNELGKLEAASYQLPNPYLLLRPYMRREAVLSTKIEGTRSSLSEVLMFEAQEKMDRPEPKEDVREVLNYANALDFGLKKIAKEPVSAELMLEMHRMLLKGVRGEDKEPGKIRTRQNWIGTDRDIMRATFVPPEPHKVGSLLGNLFSYMDSQSKLYSLIDIGLFHYQFETIHPFRDGNGRMGRLLIILHLIKKGILTLPSLYMSAFFDRHEKEYRNLLLQVSQKGNYDDWLLFFLSGMEEQARETRIKIGKMTDYRRKCEDAAHKAGNSNSAMLIEYLMRRPFISIPDAADALGKTYPTTERAISELIKLGILKEATGQKRNRIFVAQKILEIIEEPAKTSSQSQ